MFPTTQSYSGEYNFAPSGGEIIMSAFGRIGVRPTEILTQHIQQAKMELNLLLAKFSALPPNLWTVTLETFPLTQGAATYSLPAQVTMVTDMYVNYGGTDKMMFPISRTEYASIANKTTQGPPNQFWFDRKISPEFTTYPVADGNGPYTVYAYVIRQIQDATLANGLNVEVPYVWLDALVAGLAHRLSRYYAPQIEQLRKADADEAWNIASTQDVENVALNITPGVAGYFRP